MMRALMIHTLACSALAIFAFFMMLSKASYFNPSNPTLMMVVGVIIALAVILYKNQEAPYIASMRQNYVGDHSYFVSTLVVILVLNGAFNSGFSDEPVRLLVLGVGYLSLKHLMKARTYYEQLGLNPK